MKLIYLLLALIPAVLPASAAENTKPETPAQLELPTYHCKFIEKDFDLTGNIDDPQWKLAEPVELVDNATGIRRGVHTVARLLWSKRYLYVAFQCEAEYLWSTYQKRDDPLYNEEAVEIFVSPTGALRQYYEIEVSPRNVVYDSFVLNGKSEKSRRWDNFFAFFDYNFEGLLTAVHLDGELNKHGAKGWSIEMAIPFNGLIGNDRLVPIAGDNWRFNLYRLYAPVPDRLQEQYAWSPIMSHGDFHRPWQFGHLTFEK